MWKSVPEFGKVYKQLLYVKREREREREIVNVRVFDGESKKSMCVCMCVCLNLMETVVRRNKVNFTVAAQRGWAPTSLSHT